MHPTCHLLALVTLFVAGCASMPADRLRKDNPEDKAQIQHRLNEVFDAAQKKDLERLDSYHFYGPKFTKFASEQLGRLDAATARKGEHDGLGSVNDLSMQADGLKIDVFRDVGIATFVLRYSFRVGTDTIEKKAQATLVFVRDRGAWKIVHEHLSAFGSNP